jgi:hypothetical protein
MYRIRELLFILFAAIVSLGATGVSFAEENKGDLLERLSCGMDPQQEVCQTFKQPEPETFNHKVYNGCLISNASALEDLSEYNARPIREAIEQKCSAIAIRPSHYQKLRYGN